MTRKEERFEESIKHFPRFAERRVGFIAGSEWADRTMLEKLRNFIDHHTNIKDVYRFLESINGEPYKYVEEQI